MRLCVQQKVEFLIPPSRERFYGEKKMKCESVRLNELYDCVKGGELDILCLDNPLDQSSAWARPMVIVVPGGAYRFVSKREGEPVAAEFFAKGFQVAVLKYLCAPQGVCYPEQLFELACAVDHVAKNAKRLGVNPKEIFLVGFSAGGHLVADYANEYRTLKERMGRKLATAAAVGLAYPVTDEHDESFENLLAGYDAQEKQALWEKLKLPALVNAKTLPTYLWTTAEDKLVPPQNTLRYALALSEHKVQYTLRVYQKGGHGLSVGSLEVNEDEAACAEISGWTADMARFFRGLCKERF